MTEEDGVKFFVPGVPAEETEQQYAVLAEQCGVPVPRRVIGSSPSRSITIKWTGWRPSASPCRARTQSQIAMAA